MRIREEMTVACGFFCAKVEITAVFCHVNTAAAKVALSCFCNRGKNAFFKWDPQSKVGVLFDCRYCWSRGSTY